MGLLALITLLTTEDGGGKWQEFGGRGEVDTRPSEGKISGRVVNGLVQQRFISIVFMYGTSNSKSECRILVSTGKQKDERAVSRRATVELKVQGSIL